MSGVQTQIMLSATVPPSTGHNTIKYHVRVDGRHEEALELFQVKLGGVHVAWTPTCTMLRRLLVGKSLAEEMRSIAPLNYLCSLLL